MRIELLHFKSGAMVELVSLPHYLCHSIGLEMEQSDTHLSFCAIKQFLVESDCIEVFQLSEAMNEIREYHRSN
jgi:hypothetical protein